MSNLHIGLCCVVATLVFTFMVWPLIKWSVRELTQKWIRLYRHDILDEIKHLSLSNFDKTTSIADMKTHQEFARHDIARLERRQGDLEIRLQALENLKKKKNKAP